MHLRTHEWKRVGNLDDLITKLQESFPDYHIALDEPKIDIARR